MAFKTPSAASEYIRELMGKEEHPLLLEMIDLANQERIPILLPESAAFMRQLILLHKPKRILEIGTAIGYSGCIFLLNSDARLTTIDKDEGMLARARENFERAGCTERCNLLHGDAGLVLSNLSSEFDFIFLDGPKAKYVDYLPVLKRLLVQGGLLLADNVLFNGLVAAREQDAGRKKSIVKKLDLFLRQLYEDSDFLTSVLEVGDGMSLSIKL